MALKDQAPLYINGLAETFIADLQNQGHYQTPKQAEHHETAMATKQANQIQQYAELLGMKPSALATAVQMKINELTDKTTR